MTETTIHLDEEARASVKATAAYIADTFHPMMQSRVGIDEVSRRFVVAVLLPKGAGKPTMKCVNGQTVEVRPTSDPAEFEHLKPKFFPQHLRHDRGRHRSHRRRWRRYRGYYPRRGGGGGPVDDADDGDDGAPAPRIPPSPPTVPHAKNFKEFACGDAITGGHEQQLHDIKEQLEQEHHPIEMERIGSTEKGTALGRDFDADLIALVSNMDKYSHADGKPRRHIDPNWRCRRETVHNRQVDLLVTSERSVYNREKLFQNNLRDKFYARSDVQKLQEVVRALKKTRPTHSDAKPFPTSFMCIKLAMGVLAPGLSTSASGFLRCAMCLARRDDLKSVIGHKMYARYDVANNHNFAFYRQLEAELLEKGYTV